MGTTWEADVRVGFHAPLSLDRLLGFLAHRAVPGLEEVREGVVRRSVRIDGGRPSVLELVPDLGSSSVLARVVGADGEAPSPHAVRAAATRMLDLDADPAAIDRVLASDPVLAPLVDAAAGTRVPGAADAFEQVVRAIVGQQVSVAGARTTLGRIAARFGEPLDHPVGSIDRAFPTPARLAATADDELGMPRSRARTIAGVSRVVVAGELDLSGSAPPGSTLAALEALHGIGPWTLAYVAMRALGDPDAFPATDLGVRRGLAALGLATDPGSIVARAERWRPYRAYATVHLWHVA
jgi:AraC family transcriptional regulator, regulatory protein of adaptative response / DNA-3-methyladenine glycosylase II